MIKIKEANQLIFLPLFILLLTVTSLLEATDSLPLRLNFGSRADIPPEPGFKSFTEIDNGKTDYAGIIITARRYRACKYFDTISAWRARGYYDTNDFFYHHIWRTFLQGNEGYGLEVKIEGLTANSCYRLSIYAWDYDSLQSMSPRVADWIANGHYVLTTEMGDKAIGLREQSPVNKTDYIFTGYACSDPLGNIILQAAKGSTNNSNWFAFINALVIENPIAVRCVEPTIRQKDVPLDIKLRWSVKNAPGNNLKTGCYYLYMSTENKVWDSAPVIIPPNLSPLSENSYYPVELDSNQTYFWRVDQGVVINENITKPDDPNTIVGDVWTFTTK